MGEECANDVRALRYSLGVMGFVMLMLVAVITLATYRAVHSFKVMAHNETAFKEFLIENNLSNSSTARLLWAHTNLMLLLGKVTGFNGLLTVLAVFAGVWLVLLPGKVGTSDVRFARFLYRVAAVVFAAIMAWSLYNFLVGGV